MQSLQGVANIGEETLAACCQSDALVHAIEQRVTQQGLQIANLVTDGRRRDVQKIRGRLKTQAFRRGGKSV